VRCIGISPLFVVVVVVNQAGRPERSSRYYLQVRVRDHMATAMKTLCYRARLGRVSPRMEQGQ